MQPNSSSHLYEQLIQNEENNETDDALSNNRLRPGSQAINNLSDIGMYNLNESKLRMKGFGQRQGGAINLGIATPLFIPNEMSVIQSRGGAQQNSIIGSVKDGQSYNPIMRGFSGASSIGGSGLERENQSINSNGGNYMDMTRDLLNAL